MGTGSSWTCPLLCYIRDDRHSNLTWHDALVHELFPRPPLLQPQLKHCEKEIITIRVQRQLQEATLLNIF